MSDRPMGVRFLMIVLVIAGIARANPVCAEVLARSTFDADSEGWLVKDLPFPTPGAPPTVLGTYTPTYHGTGGNPGGYLASADPTGNTWFWYAPTKFLGNKLGAYGGTLSFDLAVTGSGSPFDEEDVVLVGGGLTLVFKLPARPGTSFTSYHVGLTETGWTRDSLAGVAATQADMKTVLGALTAIYIRGEYLLNMDDVGSLDNVVLEGSGVVCDIQLNQSDYGNGDQITAQVFRLANQAAAPVAIELKLWLEVPGIPAVPLARAGADGSLVLPAGVNQDAGPIALFAVAPTTPRGPWAFSCRMLHPVTGALLAEDLNAFTVH